MDQEKKDLIRHIKKLNRQIEALKRKLEINENYIKELEDIEDNRLTCLLRDIKNKEMEYFDYSCFVNAEDLLEYHITIKRTRNKVEE